MIPPERGEPEFRIHEGYEWLYVLSGRMRLILGDHDITMGPGEVAEFDTKLPHWFGPADDQPSRCSACTTERAIIPTCAPNLERLAATRHGE